MEETKTSRAWLLDFGEGLQAAVGHHEMWQIIISPTLFHIPCTPPYCNNVLIFQGNILPVLDIPILLGREPTSVTSNKIIGIAVYQDDPNHPIHYGCFHLATMPQNIYVSDDEACELSAQQRHWKALALSSFSLNDVAIPIINLAYLFAAEFHNNL